MDPSLNLSRRDAGEYLSDYVLCSEQCLLRDEAWNCEGICQPHAVPCKGVCPVILCPEDWLYAQINGRCVRVPNQVHCAADAVVPLYTGPLGGISFLYKNAPSLVRTINTTNLVHISQLSPCPGPFYCKTPSGCCLIVGFSPNRPLKCPTRC